MRRSLLSSAFIVLALTAGPPDRLTAQDHATMDHAAHAGAPAATSDSAFRALQQRGKGTMGVDQDASRHRFEDLPDGGRIELQMRDADSAGIAAIRAHLQLTARQFGDGVFSAPEATHAMVVPGTAVMAARKERIRYTYRELPQGGEVRITTQDPEALAAVREFLAFQRSDHRVGS